MPARRLRFIKVKHESITIREPPGQCKCRKRKPQIARAKKMKAMPSVLRRCLATESPFSTYAFKAPYLNIYIAKKKNNKETRRGTTTLSIKQPPGQCKVLNKTPSTNTVPIKPPYKANNP